MAALALNVARHGDPVQVSDGTRPDGRRLTSVREYAQQLFRAVATESTAG
jgi:hypothetical protein